MASANGCLPMSSTVTSSPEKQAPHRVISPSLTMLLVPLHGPGHSITESGPRPGVAQSPDLAGVRDALGRRSLRQRAGHDLDLPAVAGGDRVSHVLDAALVLSAQVVDAVLRARTLPAGGVVQLLDEVVYVDEAARLLAGALNRELDDATGLLGVQLVHADGEFRDHMLAPHVRPDHVVRPDDVQRVQDA